MSTPCIGYDNVATRSDAVLTTAGGNPAASGYALANAVDWMTWDYWRPTNAGPTTCDFIVTINGGATSVPVDYLAIGSHNLYTVGVTSLKLQKDIGAGWVDVVDATARIVSGNKPIFITFTQASAAKWRILIAYPSLVPSIGVLSLGARLDIPLYMRLGWTPPSMSNDDEYTNHLSMGGAFVGRSLVARGVEGKLEFDSDTFTAAWIRANWLAFIEHARTKPFFFSWDEGNFPSEAAYLWAEGRIDDPAYTSGIHMRASMKVRGLPT